MTDKLLYIPNDDTPSLDYNYWLKCLVTQLNEPTIQIQESPQRCWANEKKRCYRTLGTSNNQPNVPSLPGSYHIYNQGMR